MPPRISIEQRKKPQSICIEDKLWDDIEWVSVNKYKFVKRRGKPNVSKLVRLLIVRELKKHMPEEYSLEDIKRAKA